MSFPECGKFLDKLVDMLQFLIPGYVKEGKYQLVVAIGCTGGQHRSVYLAEWLGRYFHEKADAGVRVLIRHRELSPGKS